MATTEEKVSSLTALKGWALAICDVVDRHQEALISGEDIELESQCEEQPRPRLARLCNQVKGIHDEMVVRDVYDGEMPEFHLP